MYRCLPAPPDPLRLECALERLSCISEPLRTLAIGSVVGGIVVLMDLPVFQLAASTR